MGHEMRPVKIAAIAAAGVLGLSGCAGSDPQVAAYVDGVEVSVSQVDTVSRAVANINGDIPGGFNSAVASAFVQGKLAQELAAENNVDLSGQRAEALAGNGLQSLANDPATQDFAAAYADFILIAQTESGMAALQGKSAAASITINPRYGEWDVSRVSIPDGASGSLSSVMGE